MAREANRACAALAEHLQRTANIVLTSTTAPFEEKDVTVARASREPDPPTVGQMGRVLNSMPAQTPLERRDRALVALATLTGARAGALASFRFGHVNLAEGFVDQEGRVVRTKFAKTFRTDFHRLAPGAFEIVTTGARSFNTLIRGDPTTRSSRNPRCSWMPTAVLRR